LGFNFFLIKRQNKVLEEFINCSTVPNKHPLPYKI
jgi:hypothetical protein